MADRQFLDSLSTLPIIVQKSKMVEEHPKVRPIPKVHGCLSKKSKP